MNESRFMRWCAPIVCAAALALAACRAPAPVEEASTTPRSSLADLPHWKRPAELQVELLQGARAALMNGNTEEAFDLLARLRTTDTISYELRDGTLLFAELLEARGRQSEALRVLSEFAMHIPPDGDVLYVLGRMYLRAGDLREAERALRDATRAAPELLRGWIALAELLEDTQRADEAEEIMVHYERHLYRLASMIERSSTQEERIAAIHQFRVALPDPRISRILARALRNDSIDVQHAALMALEHVGTKNAMAALEAYAASSPNAELRQRAQEIYQALARE